MEVNKLSLIAVSVFLIGLFLGFSVGIAYKSKQAAQNSNIDQKLLSQLEKAKKLFPPILEMRSVSGTIKKVNGNVITIEAYPSPNPFEELPSVREIIVTENTKIIRQEQKNPIEFQKEYEDYQKRISQQSTANLSVPLLIPPSPFTEEQIQISDIKAVDLILVEADENIKTTASFEATRITVQTSAPITPLIPATPVSGAANSTE